MYGGYYSGEYVVTSAPLPVKEGDLKILLLSLATKADIPYLPAGDLHTCHIGQVFGEERQGDIAAELLADAQVDQAMSDVEAIEVLGLGETGITCQSSR